VKQMSELRELAIESRKCLEEIVDKQVWESLEPGVQAGVLTSEMCLRSLDVSDYNVDFSAAVMPLMKVLENELINRFYLPYKQFLRENYRTVTDYIDVNQLFDQLLPPEVARKKVVYKNRNGRYRYCRDTNPDGKVEFTLGNYQYTVGMDNISVEACDATAIQFYKQRVFNEENDDIVVLKWICGLTKNLESIVRLRNDSAHAGFIQSFSDANVAMNALVKVDKILLSIIFPNIDDFQEYNN